MESHAKWQGRASARHEAVLGLRDAIPIVLAYAPVAVAYGVLGTASGIPWHATVLISVLVYAGAAQFMIVSLFAAGATPLSMAVTILLVNARHLLYGATLGNTVTHWKVRDQWLAAFGLTDEVFAVSGSRVHDESPTPFYQYALSFAAYGSWVAGSLVGALVGNRVPSSVSSVLGFAFPALFLSLFVGQTQNGSQLAAGLCGAAVAILASALGLSSAGIIVGSILGATLGMALSGRQSSSAPPKHR